MDERNLAAAQRAQEAAESLGRTLHEKQLAYGDAGAMNLRIWEARLAQYLSRDGRTYKIPRALLAHIGRLTRVDDRIARIVSNPSGDRMGEDPWRDLAGDAIIGHIMPRLEEDKDPRPIPAQMMERVLAAVEDARDAFHECGIHELGAEMLDDLVSVARQFFGQQLRDVERADAASRAMREATAERAAGWEVSFKERGASACFQVWLRVGNQEFPVGSDCQNYSEAERSADRLCEAMRQAGYPEAEPQLLRPLGSATESGEIPTNGAQVMPGAAEPFRRCGATTAGACSRSAGHGGPHRDGEVRWETPTVCGANYFNPADYPQGVAPTCALPLGHDGPHTTKSGWLEWG